MKTISATMFTCMVLLASTITPASANQAQTDSEPKQDEDGGPLDHLADHNGDIYKTNALEKVVELLDVMNKKIEKEGKEEEEAYGEVMKHFHKDEKKTKDTVKEKEDEIAELETSLKEAEAFREGKKTDLENTANTISKNEQELSAARAGRKKDRAVFEKDEATYVESLDQLDRAMEVLKKKAPAAASASLISIAHKLQKTLTNTDFSLNRVQKDTLINFVRTAEVLGDNRKTNGELLSAPSFIQVQSKALGPYGGFESQSSGVMSTLEALQDKVSSEKDQKSKEETAARKEFKDFEEGAEKSIEDGKQNKANIETAIMQSQQQSSQDEASLQEAKQIFKSESEYLKDIQEDFYKYTREYKIRLRQRSDETIAVHEAMRILSQSVYQSYMKNMMHKTKKDELNSDQTIAVNPVTSLLQLFRKKYSAKGLSFLAMKSKTHKRSGAGADPFSKVKNMIQGMLEKLLEKQHEEAEKAAWCDKEQAKTAKEHERKTHDVEKTTDRLDAIDSSLSETITEIDSTSKDLQDLTASFAEAEKLRADEGKRLTFTIMMYKDGVIQLKKAMNVLQSYYGETAEKKDFQEVRSKGQKYRKGLSTGVIGILEIAVDDFEKLHNEAKTAEETAQADFEKLSDETEVRTAVFRRSLEHLKSRKVKLELDKSTMSNDLKSYKKELDNINSYMAELKTQCVVQGPTYEERKAKREDELSSLKEALTVLQDRAR